MEDYLPLPDDSDFDISVAISEIASYIMRERFNMSDVVILGIPKRGVPLAHRLAKELYALDPSFDPSASTGQLDITMYRDDLDRQPTRALGVTKVPSIDNKVVILVDDVLASGRTIRAALDALSDLGRPAIVRLAVIVNRQNLRQLPIFPEYQGFGMHAGPELHIRVHLVETDGEDAIICEEIAR